MKTLSKLHPDRAVLQKFLLDTLPEPENKRVIGHLNSCNDCMQLLDELSDVDSHYLIDTLRAAASPIGNTVARIPQIPIRQGDFVIGRDGKNYVLLDEVARGGMGIVFRGYDRDLDREIAIKILNQSKIEPEDLIRFRREARLAGQLQHPGIVPIHDVGQLNDGRMYIAMKLVDGTTLHEMIRQCDGSSSKSQLVEVFSQVCQTVAFAHSKQIIHRDLKPQNIMVGKFGEAQVMDWGLAKRISTVESARLYRYVETAADCAAEAIDKAVPNPPQDVPRATVFGTIMGTPAYMSPEQASGEFVDKSADVFSLGAILLEILTGVAPDSSSRPCEEADQGSVIDWRRAIQRLQTSGEDPALIELAMDCLKFDALARPSDAGAVSNRLTDYLRRRAEQLEDLALAKARTEAQLLSEQKRRQQVTILSCIIVAILACSLITGGWYVTKRNELQKQTLLATQKRAAKIRAAIRTADQTYTLAFDQAEEQRINLWNRAMVEINQVGGLVDFEPNSDVTAEYLEARQRIEDRLVKAKRTADRKHRDTSMQSAVAAAIRRSYYPDNQLRFNRGPLVTQGIEQAFRQYGIEPLIDISLAAQSIANSNIRTDLLHGLRLWRRQMASQKTRFCNQEVFAWVVELLHQVDPDDFRAHLREIEKRKDTAQARVALKDPAALDSLLSAQEMIGCLKRLAMDDALLQFAEIAQRKYPQDFEISWRLASANRRGPRKDLDAALRYYQVCFSLQPDNPAVIIDMCNTLYESDDFEAAIEFSKLLRALDPNRAESHVFAAISLARLNRMDEALECCDQAIRVRPGNAIAHFNRSLILNELGRIDEALAAVESAVKLKPCEKHFFHRASFHQRGEQYDKAIDSLKAGIARLPNSRKLILKMGDLHVLNGDLETALRYFQKANESRPNQAGILQRLANALIDLQRFAEAEGVCECADCDQRQAWKTKCSLIEAVGRQGRLTEALELYQSMVKAYPDVQLPERVSQYYESSLKPIQ